MHYDQGPFVCTYTVDRRPRSSRTGRYLSRRSPSSADFTGDYDTGYSDAEFDHEFDAEDAALDMRERRCDDWRIQKHGQDMRRRMNNYPQGRAQRVFEASHLGYRRSSTW
jgi:hypothetical protein